MASRYFWRATSLSKLLDNPVNLVMKVGRKDSVMLAPMNTINWAVDYYCNLESSMQFHALLPIVSLLSYWTLTGFLQSFPHNGYAIEGRCSQLHIVLMNTLYTSHLLETIITLHKNTIK